MSPAQVRGLLTTSSAISATTLRCITLFADRFNAMRPLIEWASFDVYTNDWTHLPAGPRHHVPDTGPLRWGEVQRALKAFWMIQFSRMFFDTFNRGAFDWPQDRMLKVSEMTPTEIFGFECYEACLSVGRGDHSWTYFLDVHHIYSCAEEYLDEIKTSPHVSSDRDLAPVQRVEGDDEEWPATSLSMKHFARIFKQIRYRQDGDGFRPWRRLGFAIWDTERLKLAGFINDIRKDPNSHNVHWLTITRSEQLDRTRWLSVINKEDFRFVQQHRLVAQDSESEEHPSDYDTDTYTWSP
ncbi:hypothetical protein B0A48_09355 [Cryoendolithus antarcticus]|uniref:Uncharacterized protein n=1 Tax=Cryoendolithus antarcticus TaxID=1507870 RepID=A0A1V8T2D0_9PEZI|nr:hypothetical protein B0A48_09355 [Cryoendolithus antarcticus]